MTHLDSGPWPGLKAQLLRQYIKFCILLAGAFILSVQMRLEFSPGLRLGPEYQAQPVQAFLLILCVTAACIGLYWLMKTLIPVLASTAINYLYAVFLGTAAAVAIMILIILPDLSRLQVIYFAGGSIFLGYWFIAFPAFLAKRVRRTDVVDDLMMLWQYRALIVLWARYNIISRYSQAILGILWIILLPLFNALILTFVFVRVFHLQGSNGIPFVAFLMSGLVHWNLFSLGLTSETGALLLGMDVLRQVYFPREILVIVKLVETLVDSAFVLLSMLIINAIVGVWPNPLYLLLPFLWLLEIMFVLGMGLLTGYLSVLVRDISQLVGVATQLWFYVTPVLYPLEALPARFRFLASLNPLAPLMGAYRDIIISGRMPDLTSLYFPLVLATTVLYVGYKIFKANELSLADML